MLSKETASSFTWIWLANSNTSLWFTKPCFWFLKNLD